MLPITRRQFIKTGTAAAALSVLPGSAHAAYTKLKIGVTDWEPGAHREAHFN
jgi:hypothetical protein